MIMSLLRQGEDAQQKVPKIMGKFSLAWQRQGLDPGPNDSVNQYIDYCPLLNIKGFGLVTREGLIVVL